LAAAAALAGSPCLAAPLSAYGKLPAIEDVKISPDGKLVALELTDGDNRNIAIEQAADQKVVTVIRAGDRKVRDLRWAGSDHLLVMTSTTKAPPLEESTGSRIPGAGDSDNGWFYDRQELALVTDYNLSTRKQVPLLADGGANSNVVFAAPVARVMGGKFYAFVIGWQFSAGYAVPTLYRSDLDSGRSEVETAIPSPNADEWIIDDAGHLAARTEFDPKINQWWLETPSGAQWRRIETAHASIEHPYVMGLGRDGASVILGMYDGDQLVTREFAFGDADWGPATPVPAGASLIFDPTSDRLLGSRRLDGDVVRYSFLSAEDQAAWSTVLRALPGDQVQLVSLSADHRKLVVRDDSPTMGAAYCLIDLDAKALHWLGPIYDQLTQNDIAPVQPVSFTAQDGLKMTGYLTLPRGKPAKDLPLIVLPHGGPAARDEPFFDWWAQAMASRGYAVLQVNYRGSDGFGWDFLSAGFGQWGLKMQTDLSDGVRYLASQGTIDPKRVCIVGASYGGYAALAGATLDPGVYRCAVSIAGPSDLSQMVGRAQYQQDITGERYWDRFMGASGPGDHHLQDISPAAHADRATIPILLIHGQDDTVVPFGQSQIMERALHGAGKQVDFVVLKSEDHWLSQGATRLQMLQATMDFVEKNNPPG
jgi:dipeptidyl aminopeptidase/acylaminoacyl peptidase